MKYEIVSLPEVKSLTIKDKLSSASGVHTTSCAETLSPFHAVRLMSFFSRAIGAGSSFLYLMSVLPQLTCGALTLTHKDGLVEIGLLASS